MTLGELIGRLPAGTLKPLDPGFDPDRPVDVIAYDSRTVAPGSVFVAMRGVNADGHKFLPDAAQAGAAALVGEDGAALRLASRTASQTGSRSGIPAFVAKNARRAIAELSCALYGHPSRQINVIGVTGTNGKTTTVHLIERLYAGLGFRTGRIGTLGVKIGDEEIEGAHTTPEAPDLQKTLRLMADAGVQKVAMEVSSHALAQDRTWGTQFSTVVFTNLTQDHLDYHADMEDYFEAKKRLFTEYTYGMAVLNVDDLYGIRLKEELESATGQRLKGGYTTYSLGHPDHSAALIATDVRFVGGGTEFVLHQLPPNTDLSEISVHLQLTGLFNVYNALASTLAVREDLFRTKRTTMPSQWWQQDMAARSHVTEQVLSVLQTLTGAPGRFESVDRGQDFAVLVDYAHTPDALENVLRAAKKITTGRVLAVFGCGGDRDKTKRPKMGRIGVTEADFAFITSDNPRTEDPEAIIRDIVAGLDGATNYAIDPDRRASIFTAVAAARPGDTVVIAGKGHEDYQIVGTTKFHFDDREVAAEAIETRRSIQ